MKSHRGFAIETAADDTWTRKECLFLCVCVCVCDKVESGTADQIRGNVGLIVDSRTFRLTELQIAEYIQHSMCKDAGVTLSSPLVVTLHFASL